jgi:hypothetical protein
MERWQEQLEIKQAEFLRCIRSFQRMKEIWNELSRGQPDDRLGHKAYACQKSAIYARMEADARAKLRAAGYGALLEDNGKTLAEHVLAQRQVNSV